MKSIHISLGAWFILALISVPLCTFASHTSSSTDKKVNSLSKSAVDQFPVPILLGVEPGHFSDTWGDARSSGRTHEGTDILAPLNAFIASPTEAVVTSIGTSTLGGNYVYTANPGKERFYYAHLDHIAEGLKVGTELEVGDLIGYVGNSGNASGGPTHLHFGIYHGSEAVNPFSRMDRIFTLKNRIESIEKILENSDDAQALAQTLTESYRSLFLQAKTLSIALPDDIETALGGGFLAGSIGPARDLSLNMSGDDVKWLQQFLVAENKGQKALALASLPLTGYYGSYTQAALAEYQASVGISPASGSYGPITRAYFRSIGH